MILRAEYLRIMPGRRCERKRRERQKQGWRRHHPGVGGGLVQTQTIRPYYDLPVVDGDYIMLATAWVVKAEIDRISGIEIAELATQGELSRDRHVNSGAVHKGASLDVPWVGFG